MYENLLEVTQRLESEAVRYLAAEQSLLHMLEQYNVQIFRYDAIWQSLSLPKNNVQKKGFQ